MSSPPCLQTPSASGVGSPALPVPVQQHSIWVGHAASVAASHCRHHLQTRCPFPPRPSPPPLHPNLYARNPVPTTDRHCAHVCRGKAFGQGAWVTRTLFAMRAHPWVHMHDAVGRGPSMASVHALPLARVCPDRRCRAVGHPSRGFSRPPVPSPRGEPHDDSRGKRPDKKRHLLMQCQNGPLTQQKCGLDELRDIPWSGSCGCQSFSSIAAADQLHPPPCTSRRRPPPHSTPRGKADHPFKAFIESMCSLNMHNGVWARACCTVSAAFDACAGQLQAIVSGTCTSDEQ